LPIETIDRYGTIWFGWRQCHVSSAPLRVLECSVPLLAAAMVSPSISRGIVSLMSYFALSFSELLTGYQVIAPTGSFTAVAPSSPAIQPSREPSGSMWVTGEPEYVITVVNSPSTGVAGVTMSLYFVTAASTSRVHVAGAPFTVTESTERPSKSSENSDSGTSAVAVIFAVAAIVLVVATGAPGVQAMSRS